MSEQREMSLDEWMDKLPSSHRARKELDSERATNKALVEALEPFAEAVHDDGQRIVSPDKEHFINAATALKLARGK